MVLGCFEGRRWWGDELPIRPERRCRGHGWFLESGYLDLDGYGEDLPIAMRTRKRYMVVCEDVDTCACFYRIFTDRLDLSQEGPQIVTTVLRF